jgi:hypothetical protein
VIQKVNLSYLLNYIGAGECVTAKSIAARGVGIGSQSAVGDECAIGSGVVVPLLDICPLMNGDIVILLFGIL